jgi:hypothetical protein
MESVETNSSGQEHDSSAKKQRSQDSFDSNDSVHSNSSQDATTQIKSLPTFTNEVVVIRPEQFYENEDC